MPSRGRRWATRSNRSGRERGGWGGRSTHAAAHRPTTPTPISRHKQAMAYFHLDPTFQPMVDPDGQLSLSARPAAPCSDSFSSSSILMVPPGDAGFLGECGSAQLFPPRVFPCLACLTQPHNHTNQPRSSAPGLPTAPGPRPTPSAAVTTSAQRSTAPCSTPAGSGGRRRASSRARYPTGCQWLDHPPSPPCIIHVCVTCAYAAAPPASRRPEITEARCSNVILADNPLACPAPRPPTPPKPSPMPSEPGCQGLDGGSATDAARRPLDALPPGGAGVWCSGCRWQDSGRRNFDLRPRAHGVGAGGQGGVP